MDNGTCMEFPTCYRLSFAILEGYFCDSKALSIGSFKVFISHQYQKYSIAIYHKNKTNHKSFIYGIYTIIFKLITQWHS